ncbi:MAG: hypothetical protein J7641_23840 [Cyanobacteria bacterium SID2]|nr:hypothetical protein [Cyanobacteria bacterium SID2]MBP0005942.1 hypothetical protein [Cyanobacteria bacterium SBC]
MTMVCGSCKSDSCLANPKPSQELKIASYNPREIDDLRTCRKSSIDYRSISFNHNSPLLLSASLILYPPKYKYFKAVSTADARFAVRSIDTLI